MSEINDFHGAGPDQLENCRKRLLERWSAARDLPDTPIVLSQSECIALADAMHAAHCALTILRRERAECEASHGTP
jgi:hypothetical protein